jgi:hypothetical protein
MTTHDRLILVQGRRRRSVLKCPCGRLTHGPLPCLYCRVVADMAPSPSPTVTHREGLALAIAIAVGALICIFLALGALAGVAMAFGG